MENITLYNKENLLINEVEVITARRNRRLLNIDTVRLSIIINFAIPLPIFPQTNSKRRVHPVSESASHSNACRSSNLTIHVPATLCI